MSLTNEINEDLKNAMRSKDEAALRALRSIKSALLLAKTEKGGNDEVDEETGVKILQKLAKQRKESIDIYKNQNRPELAETEIQELAIIEKYLPKQMDEAQVRSVIESIIKANGIQGSAQIGKLMPLAMKELQGKTDGKLISTIAKELLG
ncbi:MAG: GatB/YqeY domain-containing protein [Sphingobacteriales bacterium]|nr:MAG: GatB/YqeY domain-containing protein [Sphingobacteriales bacterium]